ncbi:MAG TPA: hypothetical protein VKW06_11155 [Candidatus Angelobacter sp.]|nr:hypothetical protein [Candidatus Angelobacter sp.]
MTSRRIVGGSIIGIAIGLLGFYFAEAGSRGMGLLLFCFIPMVAGFAVGYQARVAKVAGTSSLFALLGTLFLLIAFGKEGLLCALMAFVFLAVTIGAGAVLGIGFRLLIKPEYSRTTTLGMFLVFVPLLLAAKQMEKPLLDRARVETITDSLWVADSMEHVWVDILSIDSIHAAKPLLMYVGLPTPQRCTLEGTGVGAKRTCYFDKGYIQETVTEWAPPRALGLRIDRTHMPGRHWMGFETAGYRLEPEGSGTRLTRTTIITSHLYPVWYWRPLERWGVSSEHTYLLNDVAVRARAGK